MARAMARARALADAALTRCRLINGGPGVNVYGNPADANTWLTQPKSVERQLMVDALTVRSKPVIAVEIGNVADARAMAGLHYKNVRLDFHIIVNPGKDAENALIDLAADIETTLALDENLGGVANRMIGTPDYELDYERMLGRSLGAATLHAVYEIRWDHTAANPS